MKLLVVASTFPAHDNDPVPAFVRDQLIALKKLHPELIISVLAPHDKRSNTASFTRHESYDEYRFHYFWPFTAEKLAGRGIMPALKANPLNYLLIPFLFLGEFVALLRLTRKLRPDVIYAHWFTPQGINARWVGMLTKTPFVFTTHASDVDVWRKIPLFGERMVRGSAAKARAFTAVSKRSMAKLERFFSTDSWKSMASKGRIIPMGVDLPDIGGATQKAADDQTVILFVGRLAEKKGVQYLLPAYAAAREQLGKSILVIAGDGQMLEELKKQAQDLGLGEYVQFVGYVSGADKTGLLELADIYVVPSIIAGSGDAEGLPVSLMEGLAYGKLCVATVESGADDILTDGRDGFLVPQKDTQALSHALLKAKQLTPAQRGDVQAAARQTARQFDWAEIARQHYDFLFKDLTPRA